MTHEKIQCPICGYNIGKNNYSRHIRKCDGSYIPKELKSDVYKVDHPGLCCKFCDKECHNINSLTQHELRCHNNPNKLKNNISCYITTYRKGKTKYNCPDIMKQSKTLRDKYSNGYKAPNKGKVISFIYEYEEYNNKEIEKWLSYVDALDVSIPSYEILNTKENQYNVISMKSVKSKNGRNISEHVYVASLYLDGGVSVGNVVHHIDRNIKNNDIHNLLVFETNQDHKRFHFSKFSKLIYNEKTHLFSCVIEK